jgi:hypothetical protein
MVPSTVFLMLAMRDDIGFRRRRLSQGTRWSSRLESRRLLSLDQQLLLLRELSDNSSSAQQLEPEIHREPYEYGATFVKIHRWTSSPVLLTFAQLAVPLPSPSYDGCAQYPPSRPKVSLNFARASRSTRARQSGSCFVRRQQPSLSSLSPNVPDQVLSLRRLRDDHLALSLAHPLDLLGRVQVRLHDGPDGRSTYAPVLRQMAVQEVCCSSPSFLRAVFAVCSRSSSPLMCLFCRFLGMQEPASVLFSIANGYMHVRGIQGFRRRTSLKNPLRRLYLLWGFAGVNTWIWSTIFHIRGAYSPFPVTRELPRLTSETDFVLLACRQTLVRTDGLLLGSAGHHLLPLPRHRSHLAPLSYAQQADLLGLLPTGSLYRCQRVLLPRRLPFFA